MSQPPKLRPVDVHVSILSANEQHLAALRETGGRFEDDPRAGRDAGLAQVGRPARDDISIIGGSMR